MNRAQAFYESPLRGFGSVIHGKERLCAPIRTNRGVMARLFGGYRADRDHMSERGKIVRDFAGHCSCPPVICLHYVPDDTGPVRFGKKAVDHEREFAFPQALAQLRKDREDGRSLDPMSQRLDAAFKDHMVPVTPGLLEGGRVGERTLVIDSRRTRIPLWAWLLVSCGKCICCKRMRAQKLYVRTAKEWMAMLVHDRALGEKSTVRCWMFTGTCTPQQHDASRNAARAATCEGQDFDELPEVEQFRLRMKFYYQPRLKKFLARLRKGTRAAGPAAFRYILVCELHGGGGLNDHEPHFHILMFETDPSKPLRERGFEYAWQFDEGLGRVYQAKLCHRREGDTDREMIGRCVHYVTKYIVKSPISRVQMSKGFGRLDVVAPAIVPDDCDVKSDGAVCLMSQGERVTVPVKFDNRTMRSMDRHGTLDHLPPEGGCVEFEDSS